MATNRDNRRRAFADVVTVDAWHDPFGKTAKVSLFADVVFGTARVGGEDEAKVRFKLSLRRAEVVIVIPEAEPLKVERKSVSRDAPLQTGHISKRQQKKTTRRIKAFTSLFGSGAGIGGKAGAEAEASSGFSEHENIEIKERFSAMTITQSQTADGHYRWIVEPRLGSILLGRPWTSDGKRLKLHDTRSDITKGIAPTVRVEVRCRREDLEITDVEIKNENLWEEAKGRVGFGNRLAAAEAYIRERLLEEGLEVGNITDKYGALSFASVIAEST